MRETFCVEKVAVEASYVPLKREHNNKYMLFS
jgi:hypothetical protein